MRALSLRQPTTHRQIIAALRLIVITTAASPLRRRWETSYNTQHRANNAMPVPHRNGQSQPIQSQLQRASNLGNIQTHTETPTSYVSLSHKNYGENVSRSMSLANCPRSQKSHSTPCSFLHLSPGSLYINSGVIKSFAFSKS